MFEKSHIDDAEEHKMSFTFQLIKKSSENVWNRPMIFMTQAEEK